MNIDATMLNSFYHCREFFRQRYLANRQPAKPAIHRYFGTCVHLGIERFWKGDDFALAFGFATTKAAKLDETLLNPQERETWQRLLGTLPDVLACYFDAMGEPEQHEIFTGPWEPFVEHKWSYHDSGWALCGKIDHVFTGPDLRDIKTASAIGRNWHANITYELIRSHQLPLYDWYLRQIGYPPQRIQGEILVKPYKLKKARFELIDVSAEIIAGRHRFDEQLKFKVAEMTHWVENYGMVGTARAWVMAPWPMAEGQACVSKYGPCDFIKICTYGETARTLAEFQPRKEHLAVSAAAIREEA